MKGLHSATEKFKKNLNPIEIVYWKNSTNTYYKNILQVNAWNSTLKK